MDPAFSAPSSYPVYDQPQWADEIKSHFTGEQGEHPLDEASLEPSSVGSTSVSTAASGRSSVLKVEDEIPSEGSIWHNRVPEAHAQMRQFSQPALMNGHTSQMMAMQDNNNNFVHAMGHHPHWSASQSGSSTPTPLYGSMDSYGQIAYTAAPMGFQVYAQDPNSAVSMSPQSSQGGWASATSSDGIDQRGMLQSPTYRPQSPTMVVRSDGIRKKNARFEIPKERNLSNIDAMIQQSTDEGEKKELKQQKRLLRNRQAALDSRQRKKTHTEKLEQEKKVSEKKMFDLEEGLARMQEQLTLEREQWHAARQHMEQYIHSLQYEKDEAIRQKTVETTELRRQNNLLKECVRDLERQSQRGYAPASNLDGFNGDYEYGLDDNWDDDFGLINDEADQANRQATPKPPVIQPTPDVKTDAGFSGSTLYMCLLFGAFLAANWNNDTPASTTTSAIATSISSSEAGNVLRAVLQTSDADNTASQVQVTAEASTQVSPTSMMEVGPNPTASSSLDNLHQTLSQPSRHQELQDAFSLSAASYNHIMDPFNEHLSEGGSNLLGAPKPSQFQQAFATMQAQKDELERANGISAKLRERSLLWDQVPAQVVKDFQALVKNSQAVHSNDKGEKMEH